MRKNHILLFIMIKSSNIKIYSRNILFLKDAIYIVSASYEQFYKLFSSALLYIRANTGDNCPSTIRGPVVSVRVTASPRHEDIQLTAAEWGTNIKNVSNGKSTIYNSFLLTRSERLICQQDFAKLHNARRPDTECLPTLPTAQMFRLLVSWEV